MTQRAGIQAASHTFFGQLGIFMDWGGLARRGRNCGRNSGSPRPATQTRMRCTRNGRLCPLADTLVFDSCAVSLVPQFLWPLSFFGPSVSLAPQFLWPHSAFVAQVFQGTDWRSVGQNILMIEVGPIEPQIPGAESRYAEMIHAVSNGRCRLWGNRYVSGLLEIPAGRRLLQP